MFKIVESVTVELILKPVIPYSFSLLKTMFSISFFFFENSAVKVPSCLMLISLKYIKLDPFLKSSFYYLSLKFFNVLKFLSAELYEPRSFWALKFLSSEIYGSRNFLISKFLSSEIYWFWKFSDLEIFWFWIFFGFFIFSSFFFKQIKKTGTKLNKIIYFFLSKQWLIHQHLLNYSIATNKNLHKITF